MTTNKIEKMSENQQNANNIFATAIMKALEDPKNAENVNDLALISQLLIKIDQKIPGSSEALMQAILTNFRQSYN